MPLHGGSTTGGEQSASGSGPVAPDVSSSSPGPTSGMVHGDTEAVLRLASAYDDVARRIRDLAQQATDLTNAKLHAGEPDHSYNQYQPTYRMGGDSFGNAANGWEARAQGHALGLEDTAQDMARTEEGNTSVAHGLSRSVMTPDGAQQHDPPGPPTSPRPLEAVLPAPASAMSGGAFKPARLATTEPLSDEELEETRRFSSTEESSRLSRVVGLDEPAPSAHYVPGSHDESQQVVPLDLTPTGGTPPRGEDAPQRDVVAPGGAQQHDPSQYHTFARSFETVLPVPASAMSQGAFRPASLLTTRPLSQEQIQKAEKFSATEPEERHQKTLMKVAGVSHPSEMPSDEERQETDRLSRMTPEERFRHLVLDTGVPLSAEELEEARRSSSSEELSRLARLVGPDQPAPTAYYVPGSHDESQQVVPLYLSPTGGIPVRGEDAPGGG